MASANPVVASDKGAGVAEELVKVLNVRHSPLSFRVQPLLLHLDTFDGKTMNGEWDGGASLALVVKREVLVAASSSSPPGAGAGGGLEVDTSRQRGVAPAAAAGGELVDDTNQQEGSTTTPSAVISSAGSFQEDSWSSANLANEEVAMHIVEVEELDRSPPFAIHSAITAPPGSLAIPSNALVADVRRRGGKQRGKTGRHVTADGDKNFKTSGDKNVTTLDDKHVRAGGETETLANEPIARIALELTYVSPMEKDDSKRDSSLFGNTKQSTTLKTTAEDGAGHPADGVSGDALGQVVARATLEAAFLRRTIGCLRSITMINASSGGGGGGGGRGGQKSVTETAEESTQGLQQRFARLELAGHAVSARPGKPRLRLQVLQCQNLCAADLFGKSDPCVLVFWDGVEVGRTPIARDDLNPTFSAPENTFQLLLVPSTAEPKESNHVASRKRRSSLQTSQDWSTYNPILRLEVWDMDRDTFSRKWGKGERLGVVSLCGPCGIVPVIEASAAQTLSLGRVAAAAGGVAESNTGVMLRLSPGDRVVKREGTNHAHAQVSAGVVSIKITVDNATDDSEDWAARARASSSSAVDAAASLSSTQNKALAVRGSDPSEKKRIPTLDALKCLDASPACLSRARESWLQPRLRIRCLDARRLPLGCDGYCRVFWNGRQVGKTVLASTISRDIFGVGDINNQSAMITSSFQRNPVWWTSRRSIATGGKIATSLQQRPGSSADVVVVPLYEEPTGDRLTLEVFDGRHPRENTINGGEDALSRDALGRSLGSVTVTGECLVSPSQGRMHVELIPSLPSDKSAGVISLSVSLERLSQEEREVDEHEERPAQQGLHASLPRETTITKQECGNNAIHATTTTQTSNTATQKLGNAVRTTRPTSTPATQEQDHTALHAATPTSATTTEDQDQDHLHALHATTPTSATTTEDQDQDNLHLKVKNRRLHAEGESKGGGNKPLHAVEGSQRPKLWLRLILEGARLLHGLDVSGTSDPYCQIYLDRVWYSKTNVCWGTLTPRWSRCFEIEVFGRGAAAAAAIEATAGWGHEIRVELWDKDIVGADEFIGESHIFLYRRQDG